MKRLLVGVPVVLLAAVVLATTAPVAAHDYQRGESDHPLRYVAYALHPVGIAIEYGVTRPVHWVVSQPYARVVFGHDPVMTADEKGRLRQCWRCRTKRELVECPGCHQAILVPAGPFFEFD